MKAIRQVRALTLTTIALVAIATPGCLVQTVVGANDGGSGGSDSSSSSSTGAPWAPSLSTNSVAVKGTDMPLYPGVNGGGEVLAILPNEIHSDSIYLSMASAPVTCANPYINLTPNPCGPYWMVTVELPPSTQAVGTYTVNLDDPTTAQVYANFGTCDGGGGETMAGVTVQVVSFTDTEITVTLSGIENSDKAGTELNTTYVVPRCGASDQTCTTTTTCDAAASYTLLPHDYPSAYEELQGDWLLCDGAFDEPVLGFRFLKGSSELVNGDVDSTVGGQAVVLVDGPDGPVPGTDVWSYHLGDMSWDNGPTIGLGPGYGGTTLTYQRCPPRLKAGNGHFDGGYEFVKIH